MRSSSTVVRAAEIKRANDTCEKCGWLAWSNKRRAQLELRPLPRARVERRKFGWVVLCPACTEKHDGRQARERGAA